MHISVIMRLIDSVIRFLLVLMLSCMVGTVVVAASPALSEHVRDEIRIAVLKSEDPHFYIDIFGPTVEYLRNQLRGKRIVTEEISSDISVKELSASYDFLISTSGFYASFNPSESGLRQIATHKEVFAQNASESIGSVFVVLADRDDISGIENLRNKRIVASDAESLDGWLIAAGEIAESAGSVDKFFSEVLFTHYRFPDPLSYLESAEADAAVLPACQLEKLGRQGLIQMANYKVIGKKSNSLSCVNSGRLYPGVVVSSLPASNTEDVKAVSVLLYQMPALPDGSSWSIANDFRSIHTLFQTLTIGPYQEKPWTWSRFWETFRQEILLGIALLSGMLFHILRTNSLVLQRTSELREAIRQRDSMAEAARENMRRLNAMEKKGFVSHLSSIFAHELKQPLSAAANYANGLLIYLKNSEDLLLKESLEEILKEVKKSSELVDRVRKYAKSKSLNFERCDLAEIARKAKSSFESYDTRCRVALKVPDSAESVVDPLEIELLIVNLLRNAASAVASSETDGLIVLRVVSEDDGWVISVEDNGPRVSEEVLNKMRRALLESVKENGLGLGLTIVYGIAERHNASVEIRRSDPCGLAVRVKLKGVQ